MWESLPFPFRGDLEKTRRGDCCCLHCSFPTEDSVDFTDIVDFNGCSQASPSVESSSAQEPSKLDAPSRLGSVFRKRRRLPTLTTPVLLPEEEIALAKGISEAGSGAPRSDDEERIKSSVCSAFSGLVKFNQRPKSCWCLRRCIFYSFSLFCRILAVCPELQSESLNEGLHNSG